MFGISKKNTTRTISDSYRDLDEYAKDILRHGGLSRSEVVDLRKWSRLALSLLWEARNDMEAASDAIDLGDARSAASHASRAYSRLVKAYQASRRNPAIESAARRADDLRRATPKTGVSRLSTWADIAIEDIDSAEYWLSHGGMFPSTRPYAYGSADYVGYRG